MLTELMPTQIEDVDQIATGQDVPNFSEPGTGKTLTAVGAIERAKLQSGLIVCPTVATIMWTEVLAEELGCNVQHLATRTTKIDMLADFLVASYGVIMHHGSDLRERKNDALIIDESHYVKNPDAQRTQVLFGEDCDGTGGIYETCLQCWELTGTPIERYADDLWAQLRATQPQALHKYKALSLQDFRLQFCQMELKTYGDGAITKWVSVNNQNETVLNHMLYKEIGAIRRKMSEVEKFMPEATFRDVTVRAALDRELVKYLAGKTDEQIKKLLVNGDIHMSSARKMLGNAKVDSAAEYIAHCAEVGPVLAGVWHVEAGKELVSLLEGKHRLRVGSITGSTSVINRERKKQAFMRGDLDVLVGQIQAMGMAMDGLQKAGSHVVVVEDDWSPSKIEQFYKRLARKGQRDRVQVDFCRTDNKIDKLIREIRTHKEHGITKIVNRS